MLRGILERTRGDVTMAMRQEQMRQALVAFEERVMGQVDPTEPFALFAMTDEQSENG